MESSYGRRHYAPEPPAVSLTRARPWLVGLAASATMLVLILAIGNPPVTRTILRHTLSSGFGSRVLQSLGAFGWDFRSDGMHLYLANLVADIAIVVLVLLLVAALAARSGSFWRTVLAAWVSVIVAVVLCEYLRAAIINPMGTAPDNKAEAIFFSQYSPGPLSLFGAILYGLVVALVAGLVAVLTRRRPVVTAEQPVPVAAPAEPAQPATPQRREPWAAPPAPGPVANLSPWTTVANPSPWTNGTDDEHTTQLPAVGAATDDGSQHTRALPRIEDDRPPR